MSRSPSLRPDIARLVPAHLGRQRPGPIAIAPEPDADRGRRELVVTSASLVAIGALASGQLIWLVALLVLVAMVLGSLEVIASDGAALVDRGVAIESLILPSLAAVGALGAIRLVPVGFGIVPAVAATAWLVDRALTTELRLAASSEAPTDDDRTGALVAILVIALVAFVGVAAIVPGGLAGVDPGAAAARPLPIGDLVLLALADAVVGGLLGYRAAALRTPRLRDALWAAGTYATAIAVGAAALRAMGIPRLVGPALLMFLFYLWDSVHATPPTRRRDPRWIWETIALAGVGAAVAFWNLRLIG